MMTPTERLALRPGDRLTVCDDFGGTFTATVRSLPWQLGHGAYVVLLTGRTGGYDLDRVFSVVQSEGAK